MTVSEKNQPIEKQQFSCCRAQKCHKTVTFLGNEYAIVTMKDCGCLFYRGINFLKGVNELFTNDELKLVKI